MFKPTFLFRVLLFLFYFLLSLKYSFSQENKNADSLLNKLGTEEDYAATSNIYFELFRIYYHSHSDSAIIFAEKGIQLAEKTNNKGELALFYNASGLFYLQKVNYALSLEHLLKALKIRERLHLKKETAISMNNIGLVYQQTGNYKQGSNYFNKALNINKELKNEEGISLNLDNLSITYSLQKDFNTALLFGLESLKGKRKLNDSVSIAATLSNIGNIFDERKEFDKALIYYSEALVISKKMNDTKGVAIRLVNIGELYKQTNKIDSAYRYFKMSLKFSIEINDLELMSENYLALSEIFFLQKKYKEAYEYHTKFYVLTDSMFNQKKAEQISEMTGKYETEKKQKEIELLNKESEKQAAIGIEQSQKKNMIIFSVIVGLCLVTIFSIFQFNRFNVTRKQKWTIEEKQKEITDSINYAKRIQTAILPPDSYWKEKLPESFVLYQPKDIVSGDFYWVENINDFVLFAAADCTGHGVSGALVSVVCSNALNRVVKEFDITEPAKILDKTRELVLETFEKSNEEVKDGMDISLCCLNTKTNELHWSGANNPLWYIRANHIYEIKGDKQPIGKNDNPRPFTMHKIELQQGDSIYIFTDGYADQFGGVKGKKFMYKPLKELLVSIQNKAIDEQHKILHQNFISWKGDTEQTDDILLIGLKII